MMWESKQTFCLGAKIQRTVNNILILTMSVVCCWDISLLVYLLCSLTYMCVLFWFQLFFRGIMNVELSILILSVINYHQSSKVYVIIC